MKSYFCSQQNQVEAALRSGQWPEACDAALRAHVENCVACSDLVLVTQGLQQARAQSIQTVRLAAPGTLWWRAQLRRRNAAIQSVTRPVAVAEKVAVVILLLAAVALIVWQRGQVAGWLAGILSPLSNIIQVPAALLIGFAALVLFGGFAVYLLVAKE
ncbi:MAG TPA: hypothetical protein VJA94_12025 [Candidatus Angelobacter sp.]